MFFTYNQNNSGGSFDGAHYIIIEADSAQSANKFAENYTPIYFNGCDSGRDCSCCGDRWYAAWRDDEGTKKPEIYGHDVSLALTDKDKLVETEAAFLAEGYRDFDIYFKDGTRKQVRFTDENAAKAKKLKRAAKQTVWGFKFYTGWDKPMEVFQAFEADYGNGTTFWHEDGNQEITLSAPGKYGYNVETSDVWGDNLMISFSALTEDEANKAYAEFTSAIQEIIDIKAKAAEDMKKKVAAVTGTAAKPYRSGL